MKKFLISEEERSRILGMHKTATKKNYLTEEISAPEPILKASKETSAVFYQDKLPIGKTGPLDETKKEDFLSKAANVLINSKSTIAKFYNDKTFKMPKFIKIKVGTDATGSEAGNTKGSEFESSAASTAKTNKSRKQPLGTGLGTHTHTHTPTIKQ